MRQTVTVSVDIDVDLIGDVCESGVDVKANVIRINGVEFAVIGKLGSYITDLAVDEIDGRDWE